MFRLGYGVKNQIILHSNEPHSPSLEHGIANKRIFFGKLSKVRYFSLRFIQQMRSNPKLKDVEISGIGGIETWEDAAEFILLGAKTLQVTTGIMQYGYRIVEDLCEGLSFYMEEQGVDTLEDLVGLANRNIIPAEELNRDYKVYPEIDTDKCVGCGRCVISCYDGAHQAMLWDEEKRRPRCDKTKCVGCLLCGLVCPVNAIRLGERVLKEGRKPIKLEKMKLQDSLDKIS